MIVEISEYVLGSEIMRVLCQGFAVIHAIHRVYGMFTLNDILY